MSQTIFTIGHSTRRIGELISLLQENGVLLLIDVRAIPKSRHNPQFTVNSLKVSLPAAGIKHEHMPLPGGLGHAKKDAINLCWRSESFRGFADYMQTKELEEAIEELIGLSGCHVLRLCARRSCRGDAIGRSFQMC